MMSKPLLRREVKQATNEAKALHANNGHCADTYSQSQGGKGLTIAFYR